MNDIEKLQKLIELAWDHGWEWANRLKTARKEGASITFWENHRFYFHIHKEGEMYDVPPCDTHINSIFFDHDFIKALCKAKHGHGLIEFVADGLLKSCDHALNEWEYVLCKLALSTDRIGYLAGEFLTPSPLSLPQQSEQPK